MEVQVIGFAELQKRIRDISEGLSDDSTNAIYLTAVRNIATVARNNAPVGDHPVSGKLSPGRLRRSIIAKAFTQGATRRFGPGAFSQVTLLRGLKAAPYAHIVESGRKAMSYAGAGKGAKKFFSWVGPSGYRFFTRRVRGFSGKFFFQRAVESAGSRELGLAANRLNSLLKRKYDLN